MSQLPEDLSSPGHDPEMPEAIYLPEATSADGVERVLPTDLARGPWDPDAQHGGPPAALLARCIERHEPEDTLFVSRVAVELLRPVPISLLTLTTRTIRPGKRVQLVETVMRAGEVEIARATGLRTRVTPLEETPATPAISLPAPADSLPSMPAFPAMPGQGFITHAVELRPISLGAMGGGPPAQGMVWFRARVPLVAGEELTPTARVLMAADAQGGMSAVLDFTRYTFINPDLTVYLHR
ncbi:MAG: thioesterase family protein, partial [Acidimicrobiales bacterium]